ncbi:hypothetical protein B0H19DRAFT_1065634 [Mycena capillaripes]|nr:hypothetical protein B0H19DRAFT_1065634 [Mycena capillaripes]
MPDADAKALQGLALYYPYEVLASLVGSHAGTFAEGWCRQRESKSDELKQSKSVTKRNDKECNDQKVKSGRENSKIVTGSGYAALNGNLDLPTSLTLLDSAFNTSTGATSILECRQRLTDCVIYWLSEWSGLDLLDEAVGAEVDCKFQDLQVDTTPSLTVTVANGTGNSHSSVRISSTCVVPAGTDPRFPINVTSADTEIAPGTGYLLMIACGGSTDSYSLIFQGDGLYDFMRTMVDYSYDDISDTIDATTLFGGVPDIGGPAALTSNVVGDQITSVLRDLDGDLFYLNEADILGATNTAVRWSVPVSAKNGTFLEGLPKNMSITSQGTLHTQYFGWEFAGSTSWVLIPGTFVAIATIYVIARCGGNPKLDFDPSDTLDLVSASAAGDFGDVFTGSTEDHVTAPKEAHLLLDIIPGRELALERGTV